MHLIGYFQIFTMPNLEGFLDLQEELGAYRVMKIRMPRLKYTMLRDGLNRNRPIRAVHICSVKLFDREDLEQVRIRDPLYGVDILFLEDEMTFEHVLFQIQKLRAMDRKPLAITIDMSVDGPSYTQFSFMEGVVGILEAVKLMRQVEVAFTTTQFHPMDADVMNKIVKVNEEIVRVNKVHGVYTPYLHRANMRAKKGKMRLRNCLWAKDKDTNLLVLKKEGYVLYVRYLKRFHQVGFTMPVDGACNPVTITQYPEQSEIDGVVFGSDIARERPVRCMIEFKLRVSELREQCDEKLVDNYKN